MTTHQHSAQKMVFLTCSGNPPLIFFMFLLQQLSQVTFFFGSFNLAKIPSKFHPPFQLKTKVYLEFPIVSSSVIWPFPYLVFGTRLYFVFVTFPNFVLGTFLYQTFGIDYLHFDIFCNLFYSPVFCIQGFSEAVQLHLFLFTQCPLNTKVCQQLLKQSVRTRKFSPGKQRFSRFG